MNLDPNKTYRIEFRSYHIGTTEQRRFGIGFAHNFIAIVEISDGGRERVIEQFHGMSVDRETGKVLPIDIGTGRLEVVRAARVDPILYTNSLEQPAFILFEGDGREAKARIDRALAMEAWINGQDFTYRPLGRNSNAVAHTLARAMGYRVTGQPLNPGERQLYLQAPSNTLDLRDGGRDAPAPYPGEPKPVMGYGKMHQRSALDAPRSLAVAREGVPALDLGGPRLGLDAVEAIRHRHGFDPRAATLTTEQIKSVSDYLSGPLAGAIGRADLPGPLGDDLLLRATRTSAPATVRTLQEGLNRFGGDAIPVDGRFGRATLGAFDRRAAEHGQDRVREAVALAGARRDLDGLGRGEIRAEHAPTLFRDTVGRLFDEPSASRLGLGALFAAPARAWRPEALVTQRALNESNSIFGHSPENLVEDGDFGPKTGAVMTAAARAAGGERLSDHLGKRLDIGEPSLGRDRWRGFDHALGVNAEPGDAPAEGAARW
jgi:hypothetical protein